VPLPVAVDLVTVTAQHFFPDGAAPTGTITFRPSGDPWLVVDAAGAVIVPKTVTCTLDSEGRLVGPAGAVGDDEHGVKLPATDDPDLAPNGFVYDVVATIGGLEPRSWSISLALADPEVDLYSLAPVTPVEGGGTPVVTSVNGITPDATGALTLNATNVPGALTAKAPVTLTDAATIATNAALASTFRVTLGGNRTLGNPTNPTDGQLVRWEITQDATGGRTLTLDSKFVLGSDLTAIALSSAAGKTDVLGAVYHQASDRWRVVALAKGF
jgi:hypothetical protein